MGEMLETIFARKDGTVMVRGLHSRQWGWWYHPVRDIEGPLVVSTTDLESGNVESSFEIPRLIGTIESYCPK